MQRHSRISRQSVSSAPIPTLEHDAVAVALQEALGTRVILIRALGEGGMGRVYLARDPQLKRFVAVKVLVHAPHGDAEAHARFQREAQAIAAVSHPNVVAIYGVGELPDGRPYFIMQYVSGGSMAERLVASGQLPIEMAEGILGDVAAALAAAHRRGIVHRDVKPANVLWDEDGDRATVSDFGIATLQTTEGEEQDVRITGTGMAVGSPAYMSPEQLLTEPITPKSDIYALGLLGYELLTARGPYSVKSPSELVAAHLRDRPRRLSEVRTDIPEALQELLLRCLSKEPDDRPTAEEVMLAMTPGAADALEWPPPGLERLRAGLWRLMSMPFTGALFLLVPLLALVRIGHDYGDDSVVGPLVLGASSLIAFAAFLRGGIRAWNITRALARAASLGYGWGTIVEVMSDRRGDTGSLIAGTREYSTLQPAERARLRTLRVAQALFLFLGPPITLVVAIVALVTLGSDPTGAPVFVRTVVGTAVALASLGVLAGVPEYARLTRTRRKRAERPHRTNERELAPAWYAAFERSRDDQGFGPGRNVSPFATALAIAAGTIVVLACAMTILSASVITGVGQVLTGMMGGSQASLLAFQAQRLRGGTTYRTTAADSVSPVEAGEALLAVASTTSGPRTPSPLEREQRNDYPRWTRVVPTADMFPKPAEMLWTSAAIRAAGRGLTPEQHDLLRRSAAHPARAEFSRAATARALDIYGALLRMPLPETVHFASFPVPSLYGVRDAAESHAALVAIDVAERRPADAERHAREIISVGAQLLDVPILVQATNGFEVLARGVGALEAVYIATGREAEARALMDSVVTATARNGRFYLGSNAAGLRRATRNDNLVRGVRMELMVPLLVQACSDPNQLLFGANDTYRRDVRFARDTLARYPSERAYVDALDGMLSRGVTPEEESSGVLPLLARSIDWVVGGSRFESCASLVNAFRRD